MPVSTITLNGNTVSVVTLPATPGFRTVEFDFNESVGIVKSIFTGQVQAQRWAGADFWSGQVSLPPLTQSDADAWIAALMECRGMSNAFMVGDPLKSTPRGTPTGVPTVDNSVTMKAGDSKLYTYGWTANSTNNLLAGDYIQVGVRLLRVLENVNADANGKAAISIWPTLRETPSGLVITSNPKGLFRLAQNANKWSADYSLLSSISFPILEYR